MNPTLRELLTDLKAAALIGHPESLASALDGVRALDDEQLPTSALLPLGRALTPLPAKTLKPLYVDDDPAIRAVVSVALGERYLQGKDVTPADLDILADDPNAEVITALARALTEFTPARPEKLAPLVETWLKPANQPTNQPSSKPTNKPASKPGNQQAQKSSNPQTLQSQTLPALLLLPHLPLSFSLFPLLDPLDTLEDHDLREGLVTCLSTLVEKGRAEIVLDLLAEWTKRPTPNTWLITRALSASWAQSHREQAVGILNDLAAHTGMTRPIVRALDKLDALPPTADA